MLIFFQRYYSSYIDAFLSLACNAYSPFGLQFTKSDALGFVLFASVTSNGQAPICEVVRIITESLDTVNDVIKSFPELNFHEILESNHGCLYNTLYDISESYCVSSPGSSTDPRHTYSSSGRRYPFIKTKREMLELLHGFSTQRNNVTKMRAMWVELKKTLCGKQGNQKTTFPGIGPTTVHNFLHLCALLGLLPLRTVMFASLLGKSENRGPYKLINTCARPRNSVEKPYSTEDCDHAMNAVTIEVQKLLGMAVYVSLKENIMCEVNRAYEDWLKSQPDSVRCAESVVECFTQSDDDLKDTINCCGEKVDLIFIYRNRHQSHRLQKLFRLCDTSTSTPLLKLISHEHLNGEHYVKTFKLTTWQVDIDSKCMDDNNICNRLYWQMNDELFLPKFVLGMYKSVRGECMSDTCIDSSRPNKVHATSVRTVTGKKHVYTRPYPTPNLKGYPVKPRNHKKRKTI